MKKRESSSVVHPAKSFLSAPGMAQLILIVVTIVLNLQMLTFSFVYDDNETIIRNIKLASLHPAAQAPGNALLSGKVALLRPVTGYWMHLNVVLFGLKPAGWHASSIALHLVVTLLAFAIARKLLQDKMAALAVALIFALHPTHVENVAWVSAVNDLLMSAFLLGSFLLFLRYREQRSPLWLWLSAILYGLGLLSKETAVVFPLIVLTYAVASSSEIDGWRSARALKRAAKESLAYFVVLGFYFCFRIWSLRDVTSNGAAGSEISWNTMALTWPSVLWFQTKHLIAPTRLSEFYPGNYVEHLRFVGFVLPLLLVLLVCVAVALLVRKLQSGRQVVFAGAWIVFPIIPSLYLRALTPNDFLHDRFLYLSTFGLAILLVLIVRELPGLADKPQLGTLLLSLIIAAELVGYVMNERPWKNDVLLCENGLRFVPDSSRLRDNMASGLVLLGRGEEAKGIYQEVLDRDPQYWRSYYNLGLEYLKEGNYQQGAQVLLRGIEVDPRDSRQFIMLAAAQLKMNELEEASKSAQEAIKRSPRANNYHAVLGDIYFAQGDFTKSLAEYRAELSIDPSSAAARAGIRRVESVR